MDSRKNEKMDYVDICIVQIILIIFCFLLTFSVNETYIL